MFTGIIQDIGKVIASEATGGDRRLRVHTGDLDLSDMDEGDSIAVSGVCLTALNIEPGGFEADVSLETLELTTLGDFEAGDPVNLELALTPASRLGGHLVTGHVDGRARVLSREPDGRSQRFEFEAPAGLARFIAAKGSVALDGVSLTVNSVAGSRFDVNLIPHTMERTTLGDLGPGDQVNLEVDLMARYAARLCEADGRGMDEDRS